MNIYLLRHGETANNVTKCFTGTSDVPVSPAGLAKLQKAPFTAKTVYVSPLCRARQTAEALFPAAQQIAVQDLRERCFGEAEGTPFMDLSACVADEISRRFRGVEEKPAFVSRTNAAFAQLVDAALLRGDDTLVIVAHGGTQMAVLHTYAQPPRAETAWCGKNGGGFLLSVSADEWQRTHTLCLVQEVCYAQ